MNYFYPNQYYPANLSMQETPVGAQQMAGSMMPGMSYMILPLMPEVLEEEQLAFEDARRLQSFYPEIAQKIQQVVEEECDKLEYEGSMMFDEYPDRVMLWKLSGDIFVRVWDALDIPEDQDSQIPASERNRISEEMDRFAQANRTESGEDMVSMQSGECRGCRPGGPGFGPGGPGGPNFGPGGPHRPPRERPDRNHLRDFVQVLLLDEMHRRRCRHRRCRRFW